MWLYSWRTKCIAGESSLIQLSHWRIILKLNATYHHCKEERNAATLTHVLVTFHLGYCKVLLYPSLTLKIIQKVELVQKTAWTTIKSHMVPILKKTSWAGYLECLYNSVMTNGNVFANKFHLGIAKLWLEIQVTYLCSRYLEREKLIICKSSFTLFFGNAVSSTMMSCELSFCDCGFKTLKMRCYWNKNRRLNFF